MPKHINHDFTTKRLVCTLINASDVEVKQLYQTKSTMKHLGGALTEKAANQKFELMVRWNNKNHSPAYWKISDKLTGDFIGVQGLTKIPAFESVLEIGILLNKKAEGRGYPFEALKGMCNFAFHTLNIEYLIETHKEMNTVVTRIAKRLGFTTPVNFIYQQALYQLRTLPKENWQLE